MRFVRTHRSAAAYENDVSIGRLDYRRVFFNFGDFPPTLDGGSVVQLLSMVCTRLFQENTCYHLARGSRLFQFFVRLRIRFMGGLIGRGDVHRWAPGERTLDSVNLGWRGARLCGYRHPGLDVSVPALRDHAVILHTSASTRMSRRCYGGNWRTDRVVPGSVSLLSQSTPARWRWNEAVELLHLSISSADMGIIAADVYQQTIRNVELHDVLEARDPVLEHVIRALAAEVRESGIGGSLYVEALRNQACIWLTRHYSNVTFKVKPTTGGLSATQRRLLTEYMNEHLVQSIKLADLANVAGLSVYQFFRKFRTEFGCAPHTYVLRLRVENAKRLLKQCCLPLKAVAADSGFADQSHMTRLFRRQLNVTPADYRRQL